MQLNPLYTWTFFFENMLSHFERLYAHTREHIQDKDHKNIRHVHKQNNIIIMSY